MAGKRFLEVPAACEHHSAASPEAVRCKKACASMSQPAQLPPLPCPQSLAFLSSIARFMGGAEDAFASSHCPDALQHQALLAGTSVPVSFWLCTAELNLLFGRWFSSLPGSALRSYHSFTRMPKEMLWTRFAESQELSQAAASAAAAGDPAAPMHMKMLHTLLGRVFTYPEAGIIKYRFAVQPWMFGWSHKWGMVAGELTVVAVQAYTSTGAGSSTCRAPEQPLRTVYIPIFNQ